MKQKVHSLIDKVYSRQNLELAWKQVRQNGGCAGIDGITIRQFEERQDFYLDVLHRKLRDGTYRPEPVKRVEIPKSDAGTRKLGIPTMRSYYTSFNESLESELASGFYNHQK
jgi:RNA-directed DNA polymerase